MMTDQQSSKTLILTFEKKAETERMNIYSDLKTCLISYIYFSLNLDALTS
jgi:hypothetical protein